MARNKRRKQKQKRTEPAEDVVSQFIKLGKHHTQLGDYAEAIAAYEAAMDRLYQLPDKIKRRYESLRFALAELYVQTDEISRAREIYEQYLGDLLEQGRVKKFQVVVQESSEVAGVDLHINLVTVLRRTDKIGFLHQLSGPIINQAFSQAVEAYETNPDPFILSLIENLLPRIQIELPDIPDSLESRLAQPNGLVNVLEKLSGDTSLPVPASAAIPTLNEDERKRNLWSIWSKRIYGTLMYRGANYGIRAAILFLMDMLDAEQGISRIEIEGLEDFDVYYDQSAVSFSSTALAPRVYVQAKSRDQGQPAWSISQLKGVLNSFAEVHCEDNEANFLFLTDNDNFGQQMPWSGLLGYSNLWELDRDHTIRDELLRVLKPEFTTDKRFNLDTFLKRICFRILSRELEYLIIERLADFTGSPKGVAVRYYDALFEEVHALAETKKSSGETKAISRPELERFLHEVISSVDISAIERPLRRGNMELLTFGKTDEVLPQPDPNFYLGVYADIRHILANQDIPRPELMQELAVKLVQRNFCVLRSPSGTGKTTLMYRFAYEHRHSFSVFRLQHLDRDPETIGDCIRYMKLLQPSEHSPVLILIDDISRPEKRGWQEFVKPILENPNIFVIATTREDEWSDFLARGINIEYVYLSLSEDTARHFHQMLKERDQLHSDYPDWREAYEASKTNGVALFMEYAHILTKGKRIQEVLNEQIERIARQSAPDGPIQMNLLRIICTAHAFGGRVRSQLLPHLINTHGEDLHRHLANLADEHLITQERQHYIGLHEVRSRFLSDLTHHYPPPSLPDTLKLLMAHLPLMDLTPIVEGACRSMPNVAADVLDSVALRLNRADEKLIDIAEVIRRLYIASEWHYAQEVKAHLDNFSVEPVDINVFAVELAPALTKSAGFLDMELFRAETREAFATAPPRGPNRFEKQIGPGLDVTTPATKISVEDDTAAIVYFLNWCREVDQTLAQQIVAQTDIQHLAKLVQNEASGQRAASLLFHVWRSSPTTYHHIVAALGGQEVAIDKLLKNYPLIAKVEWDSSDKWDEEIVHLYFWAEDPLDDIGEEADVHAKTIFLAGIARRMFPTVSRVRTTGLFATGREYKLGMYDPATKDMPVENFTVLEDVEKNRIWLRAITMQYTAKTWYAYLQQQDSLRVKYITSLNLMSRLFENIQKPRSNFSSSIRGLTGLFASYQALLSEESRNLPMPPDPVATFMGPEGHHDAYRDPEKEMHDLLLQGIYHLSSRGEPDADRYFHSYVGAIDRCAQFLSEYVINGDSQKTKYLKINTISALDALHKFHGERANLQLRQAEHVDLVPVELRVVQRVQKAAQYVLERGYKDLWSEAERQQARIQLLISRLNAVAQQISVNETYVGIELVRMLVDDLESIMPSLSVLVQLSNQLNSSPFTLVLPEIQDYIQQFYSLTTLDCFTALAQKRWDDSKTTQLAGIEDGLRAEGVHIKFGSPVIEEDSFGNTSETLPIVFQVSDLMDTVNKLPAIFRHIFSEEFDQQQQFALVITDGQSIIFPAIWTFGYWKRPQWELAEQINPTAFVSLCLARSDIVQQYSTHLSLPVAEEPEYVQAVQTIYGRLLELSLHLVRLRQEVRLKPERSEEVKQLLDNDEANKSDLEDGDDQEQSLQAGFDYLTEFEPTPDFEPYHNDVIRFVLDLWERVKHEIDLLKQAVGDKETEIQTETLPDDLLNVIETTIDSSSSFQAKEKVQAHLSTVGQTPYEDMDTASKFAVIYFVLKNYFHFGRVEYE